MLFLNHFEQLDKEQYNELQSEFQVQEMLPTLTSPRHRLLNQLAKVYTTNIFKKLQVEFMLKDFCYIKKMNEEYYKYVIGMVDEKGEWRVIFLYHLHKASRFKLSPITRD